MLRFRFRVLGPCTASWFKVCQGSPDVIPGILPVPALRFDTWPDI